MPRKREAPRIDIRTLMDDISRIMRRIQDKDPVAALTLKMIVRRIEGGVYDSAVSIGEIVDERMAAITRSRREAT